MLFYLISFLSFILLSKTWKKEMKTISFSWFLGKLSLFFSQVPKSKKISIHQKSEQPNERKGAISLLDLPDLPLDCILEKLLPTELTNMASVCTSLRDRCTSDHLWERHLRAKWAKLIGDAAYKEWKCKIGSSKRKTQVDSMNRKGYFGYLLWNTLKRESCGVQRSCLAVDSMMAWYLSIESGKFWFPAQVYNRENGDAGFMLSCYDAELRYNSITDTFVARYSAQGRRTTEDNIKWNRLRAPAVDTPAHILHTSNCLNDLIPGDHIEIQWRRNKEFSYGWWYGVVGHLESCQGNKLYCQCHSNDTIILEFKQYSPGSRWREVMINRKDHHEVGNEVDGFYGGIRKLYNEEQISMWKHLWPTHTIE